MCFGSFLLFFGDLGGRRKAEKEGVSVEEGMRECGGLARVDGVVYVNDS